MASELVVNSLAVDKGRVVAVGDDLHNVDQFRHWRQCDLHGNTVVPGFVDAHTHFYFFALSLNRVRLQGDNSLDACLKEINRFSSDLRKNEWVVGEGYSPDRFRRRIEPDRYMLDEVTGGRPAFLFSKDQHTAWVNSKALEIAEITKRTSNPDGGEIVRSSDGTPTGILRERPAYDLVYSRIPQPSKAQIDRSYSKALDHAYRKGVTGVHSFDGPEAFAYLSKRAQKSNVGLRVNYYPSADLLPELHRTETRYGAGTDFFRIAGVKIFADGSLGSQSALCIQKYQGSRDNFGIEVTPVSKITRLARSAVRLNLPCAIHAIGDRAVSNVLDVLEQVPSLKPPARHRIEHLQLVRRKDISRVKRLAVVASMQPSHCPSDIPLIRKYWGNRAQNTFVFRTLLDQGVDLAFGSDVPIEPLDPIAGIHAAVNRSFSGDRNHFYPEQRISAMEALHAFTVGPAIASGQTDCRGYLLPGYPADFVVLSHDITKVAKSRIHEVEVLATVLDGAMKYNREVYNH